MKTTASILVKYIPKNMKRKTLAEILEVKPQYLSNILNNKRKASKNFLNKFYILFNVSSEDIENIKKYESFNNIPENIREEFIKLKEGFVNFETIYLENKGSLTDEKFLTSHDSEIINLKNGIIYKQIMEGDFFITVNTDKYSPFFKEDVLILKKIDLNIEANNKYCLIKYKGIIDLYLVKIIDKKIILNSLRKDKENYIINKSKDLKIYGYVFSSIMRRKYT